MASVSPLIFIISIIFCRVKADLTVAVERHFPCSAEKGIAIKIQLLKLESRKLSFIFLSSYLSNYFLQK